MDEYLDLSVRDVKARPEARNAVKIQLAQLFNADAGDFALTCSTGHGMSLVAAGLRIDEGQNVVVCEGDHWNCAYPWLNLRKKGVDVRFVKPNENHRITLEAVDAACDERTVAVALTAVRFDSGFRHDLKAVAELVHSHQALCVVDATQCAGANPIDLHENGVDVMVGAGFKWLLGMTGTGYLYVRPSARNQIDPISPGMFAAEREFTEIKYHDDARRYETGTLPNVILHGWATSLTLLNQIGVVNIQRRNFELTDALLEGLRGKNIRVLSPVEAQEERSAIVCLKPVDDEALKSIETRLHEAYVFASRRGEYLRASPNFFNTEDEINLFLSCLD